MKKQKYLLLIMCMLCALMFGACSQDSSDDDKEDRRTERSEDDEDADDEDDKAKDKDEDEKKDSEEGKTGDDADAENTGVDSDKPGLSDEATRLISYNWQGSNDGSLIVFEQDGTFRYYQTAEDLTDNYFEGTYEFYVGADAVEYITTSLSQYSITEDELTNVFDNNDEYDESNFVCFSLNNEACYMGGENTVDTPYQTPYFGFCLEEDGDLYLDIANMNTANYHLFIAK